MVDYSKAKIYKICNDVDDEIYIGSTCQSLSQRMAEHRRTTKRPKMQNRKIYTKINELGFDSFLYCIGRRIF